MEKTFYLVSLCFGKQNKNAFKIYRYHGEQRFTSKQGWRFLNAKGKKDMVLEGQLPASATIDCYWDIIKKYNLPEKACNRYCTFGYL